MKEKWQHTKALANNVDFQLHLELVLGQGDWFGRRLPLLKICRSMECAINHEGYVVVCREGVKSLLTNVKCQMHMESVHEGWVVINVTYVRKF